MSEAQHLSFVPRQLHTHRLLVRVPVFETQVWCPYLLFVFVTTSAFQHSQLHVSMSVFVFGQEQYVCEFCDVCSSLQ